MDIQTFNANLAKIHCTHLRFGSFQLDTSQTSSTKLFAKEPVPLKCNACGASSKKREQFRSLDNLRAVKKGNKGTGCSICKTIHETRNVCEALCQEYNITMEFLVDSFDVNTLKVSLKDRISNLAFGFPIKHNEIRNIAYGNRKMYGLGLLLQLRNEAYPTLVAFSEKFPTGTIEYLGYYKRSKTTASANFFKFSCPKKCLIRFPKGLERAEVPASEIRKLIKQQIKDTETVSAFKNECIEHNGEYLKCLGRYKEIDNSLSRGSELLFEYTTQSGLLKRNTLLKARECGFQQTPRKGERMVLAICIGLYPDGEWRANVRPSWNICPTFEKEHQVSRLEIDVLSDKYKIAVERQSDYHTKQVDPKRAPREVERYKKQDPVKKQNALKNGYKFVEIHTTELDLDKMINEFESQLNIVVKKFQRAAIETEWNAFVKDAYRQYKTETLSVLKKNGCEWVAPDKSLPVAPLNEITVRLPCGHVSENTMRYFKQGNGLIVCGECFSTLTSVRHLKRREEGLKHSLSDLWGQLPKQVREQLINQPIKAKLTCPHCKTLISLGHDVESIVEFIKHHKGFYCIHCHNSGDPKTENPHTAGTILQSKETIQQIIKKTGFGNLDKWYQYISLIPSTLSKKESSHEIVVTLKCRQGHENRNTIRRWQTIFLSKKREAINNYCEHCADIPKGRALGDEVHLGRIRKFHPKATFSTGRKFGTLTSFSCNETEHIGGFSISHPPFYASISKIKTDIKRCKTSTSGYCLPCSISKGLTTPGTDKHLEHHLCRLRMRAALIATLTGAKSIETVSIIKLDGTYTGKVESGEKLVFQCHNSEHQAITRTPNNFFNKYKKGYCPVCLAEAGVKEFQELTDKY